MTNKPRFTRAWPPVLLAAAALAGAAQANVLETTPPNTFGDFENIGYGSGGNVFNLQPYVFINLVGGADAAKTVTDRNPALAFSFSTLQVTPNLLTIKYTVSNIGGTDSFNQLRFMVLANPDGDPTDYLDVVTETWGPAAPGNALHREVTAYDPTDSIPSRFRVNANLTDAPATGGCAAAAGCDTAFALQWDAAEIAPGESFVVTVGLSDNGSTLSARYLTATAAKSAATALTFSGTGVVTAVPEPASWLLTTAGLLAIGAWTQRRRA